MAAADDAERALATHREAYLTRQGTYLAGRGAPDARPPEPVELLQAEQHLIRAQADAAAARAVIGDHEAALAIAARHVATMTAARDEAHKAAILAIISEHLDTRYVPTMLAAREHERNVWNVYDAVADSGDGRTAERIAQLLRDAKAKLAIPQAEPARGAVFCRELLLTPASAQLGQ